MKHKIFITPFLVLLILPFYLLANDFAGVQALAKRRVPWLSAHIVFQRFSEAVGKDRFVLHSQNGKLIIAASDANAAAFGLNWYLKYYCHRSMSHLADNLSPVYPLPVVSSSDTIESVAIYRHALNYCTYNYTMSFYSWQDWEHELDWMALNGVNMMLVANGEEAVWQSVLQKLGYSFKEITDYLTGPGFNAWWLMGNIQGWGGPMPQSQIDSRKRMVQKMLQRMKELGIEPVMPGFYGMVPSTLKDKITAPIFTQGAWGAFTRPDIINPADSAFNKIAGLFYEATKSIYGSDIHFFSGDPFHEGGNTAHVDLAKVGVNIQNTMHTYFPGAIWVLQGWQVNPRKEMLQNVDKSTILIQELFGENTNNWETRKGYEGTPFIWCTVTNFGERPGINGKLQHFADELYRIQHSPYAKLAKGIGIMPEGINNNPIVYDLMMELGWHKKHVNVEDWVQTYIHARYGSENGDISQAWKLLLETTYSSSLGYEEGPPENILCARPALQIKSVSSWGSLNKRYDLVKFRQAVLCFAKALPEFKASETYRTDLVILLSQLLANKADTVYSHVVQAFHSKNIQDFQKSTDQFLHLLDLSNAVYNNSSFFQLRCYQLQALAAGNTAYEKSNNLKNLMMLNTYWGANDRKEDNLHEYAYKQWAPMMVTFYKKRWVIYFDYLHRLLNGQKTTEPDFFAWERNWVAKQTNVVKAEPETSLGSCVKSVLAITK